MSDLNVTPWAVLTAALRRVPALKYVLGVAALAAVIAIARAWQLDPRIAVWGSVVVLALAVVVLVFAKISTLSSRLFHGPAIVLMWFCLLLFMIVCSLLVSCVFFRQPVDLQFWVKPVEQGTIDRGTAVGFENLLARVPPRQRQSILDWIPQSYWSHPVRHEPDLPRKPDWSQFDVMGSVVHYDLSNWAPFTVGERDLISPVLTERKYTLTKLVEADYFRAIVGTEGPAVVAACVSGQAFEVECGVSTGTPQTNISNEAHVLVRVDNYAVGERIEITIRAIMWNGLRADDPWLCLVTYGGGHGKLIIDAPPGKPFRAIEYLRYPNDQSTPIDSDGLGFQLEGSGGQQVLWMIPSMEEHCVYEVQWTF